MRPHEVPAPMTADPAPIVQKLASQLARAEADEFFICKAIGWALREYSYVAPDAVRAFVEDNRDRFSGLTIREATKRLE
jgi:3-methyladenine DNA glycosylase AlkD